MAGVNRNVADEFYPVELQPMNPEERDNEERPNDDGSDEQGAGNDGLRDALRRLCQRRWKEFSILMAAVVPLIIAISALAATGTWKEIECHYLKTCSLNVPIVDKGLLRGEEMFSGLAPRETEQIINFMMDQHELNLKKAENATLEDNYIYSIEEELPPKKDVLQFLDGYCEEPPARKAKVILFMGKTKEIAAYMVSPVPFPVLKVRISDVGEKNRLTWKARPLCNTVETPIITNFIIEQLSTISDIFLASFTPNCKQISHCIYMNIAPRVVIGSPERHLVVWFNIPPDMIADYYVYPLPLYIIIKTPGNGIGYTIVKVYYHGDKYDSFEELKAAYAASREARYELPDLNSQRSGYGSPDPVPHGDESWQKRPPLNYHPDGPRLSVGNSSVEWLGWSFNIHPRTQSGLQLFNVKFKHERIAYELSMQDILVLYSGGSPDNYFRNFFDNGWSIGRFSMPLIRGQDCPHDAIFLDANVYGVSQDRGVVMPDAICVFEYRNSLPLRRHFSATFYDWGYRYAFSMPDTVLIVRQILTVWNYDYIFDYEFHQNGMIDIKASSTGYVAMTNFHDTTKDNYGYLMNDHWQTTGNVHQHLFNFKMDLDVGGTTNKFKIIDIKKEKLPNNEYAGNTNWQQMHMEQRLVENEKDAAIKYDFEKPKFYVVQSNEEPSPRGYRIVSNHFSYVVGTGSPFLTGAGSWAKYQLAVTKFNESERTTVSEFSQGDPFDAAVNFGEFINNNDSIKDEDLVVWATLGLTHVPTREDLPVTTIPGKTLVVSLAPFNYFQRDPSTTSRDVALFWNKSFKKTNVYFHQNNTCKAPNGEPSIHT